MLHSPSPLILQSSGWGGNDGNWSTFQLNVGTPPQGFNLICSTTSSEIWIPLPEGCNTSITGCASSRGVQSFNGVQSSGSQTNESSSWKQIGIYALSGYDDLFPDSGDAALYGLDNISLSSSGNTSTFGSQIVGGISSYIFWLGVFGLGIQPGTFSNLPNNATTLLESAKEIGLSPSASYGFYAGAAYRNAPGSVILGGYDQAAFEPSNITFSTTFAGPKSLTVRLKSLVVTNTPQGTVSPIIDTSGLNVSIDSTVAQLWLPGTLCDALSDALGLQYDNGTELYFVNATMHDTLLNYAPEFTFIIAASSMINKTTAIVLPYAAFDQQIGQPWSTTNTTYFPIRRAANESQLVLGRTFLQEAYLIVDWERENFTLGQSLHRPGVSSDIVTIHPVSSQKDRSSELTAGAISGIVVSMVLLALLMFGGGYFLRHRRRRKQQEEANRTQIAELDGKAGSPGQTSSIGVELMSNNIHEMSSPPALAEKEADFGGKLELEGCEGAQLVDTGEIYELPGHEVGHEMDGVIFETSSRLSAPNVEKKA
ncbi:hypothetical protein CKM354_000909800 [Cercospora kikuchii]|uniref:Peptidase A1 domain-containing protein n=1 Tax=Cercospora kikuchii TaxID=84275 RepID=A0A9P3CNE1_9PEZI|nr:uncharacterized protein CKM354_000909800 [Cercospora kikuchii]GIZ45953.1 hypothetical protein CKM354_000909800 [Cercospora kikuchii]